MDIIKFKNLSPQDQKETYELLKKEQQEHYKLMKHRVEEDVKINTNLWVKMLAFLRELYDTDEEIIRVIRYLNFKMECLYIQSQNKILIDLPQCQKNLDFLQNIIEEKRSELATIMPKVPIKAKRNPPSKPYKKDGSLSATGIKWHKLLDEEGLPDDYDKPIEVITGYEDPNPGSSAQMKSFLFSKGWVPKLFKPGANGPIPQLRNDDKELCTSIYKLIETQPELEALDGLSVAQHRSGYLKSFLAKSDDEGYAEAWAHAFTRTLRLKHVSPFVNLPKPNSHYGELVRSVMVAPKGYVCIGADLSSIEDKCKQISIFHLDPDYVESMNTKGWDAHLALGLMAGIFTQDEVDFYKWYKAKNKLKEGEKNPYNFPEVFKNLSEYQIHETNEILDKKRANAKTSNYACVPNDSTEVLTKRGWKFVDDLSLNDKVLSFNEQKEFTEFTDIEYIHKYKDTNVFSLSNKWWNIESTLDHRWLVDRRTGKNKDRKYVREYINTENITSECNIINSKPYIGGNLDITENEASFLGWLLSDDFYQWSKKSNKTSSSNGTKRGIKCVLSQSKKKYYKEVKSLLISMDYYKSEYTNNSNCEVFYVKSSKIRKLSKKLGFYGVDKHNFNWSNLILNMNIDCLKSFFESFFLADGNTGKISCSLTNSKTIYQNKGTIKDAIILCGYLLGYKVTESLKSKSSKCYDIRFSNISHTTGQGLKRKFSRKVDTFCLTTPNSNFIIRQNGYITITGNCTYGAGAKKLSEGDMTLKEAKELHKGYWKMNWAVKRFSADRIVKTVKGDNYLRLHKKAGGLQKVTATNWIWNEYTKMWLFLKNDKDRFSACNQSFAVKVFDTWGWYLIQAGIRPIFQSHDEFLWYCKEEDIEEHKRILDESVVKLNKAFNSPVPLEISYDIGSNYSSVH